MAKNDPAKHIVGTWVHVFEQDTSAGAIFRPEDGDIPLSRRPRERIEVRADGSAVLWLGGPDDRYVAQPATWARDGDDIVVRDARNAERLRVVDRQEDRLVVRMPQSGGRRT